MDIFDEVMGWTDQPKEAPAKTKQSTAQQAPVSDMFDEVMFGTPASSQGTAPAPRTPPPTVASALPDTGGNFLTDTGIDVAKGVIGLGESAVGLGNIVTGNLLGKGLSQIGYDPDASKKILDSYYSQERQASNAAVEQAQGFIPTAKAYLKNPRALVGGIAESAPGSLGVVAGARQALGKMGVNMLTKAGFKEGTEEAAKFMASPVVRNKMLAKGALISGGLEGAQTTGQIQEQARQEGKDWSSSVLPAIGAGAGTAGIGILTSKIPGFRDVEAKMAMAGMAGEAERKTLLQTGKEIAKDMFKEGVLEEMPQSAQEQVFTNLATNKPWDEGVAKAAAAGGLIGAAQGGGMSVTTAAINRALPNVAPESGVQTADSWKDDIKKSLNPDLNPDFSLDEKIRIAELNFPKTQSMIVKPEVSALPVPGGVADEQLNEAAMERPVTSGLEENVFDRPITKGYTRPEEPVVPQITPIDRQARSGALPAETEELNQEAMNRRVSQGLTPRQLPEEQPAVKPETLAGATPQMPTPARPKIPKTQEPTLLETHEQRYTPEKTQPLGRSERRTKMIESRVSMFDQQAKTNEQLISLAKAVYPDLETPTGKAVPRSAILDSIRTKMREQENYRGPIPLSAKPLLESVNNSNKWQSEQEITAGDTGNRSKLMKLVEREAVQQAFDQDGNVYYAPAKQPLPSNLSYEQEVQSLSYKAPDLRLVPKSDKQLSPEAIRANLAKEESVLTDKAYSMEMGDPKRPEAMKRLQEFYKRRNATWTRLDSETELSLKAPNKPVAASETAEPAVAIHWSNKPLTTVYGAGKKGIEPAGYSRADIQRRMNQSSEYMPDPGGAVEGYTKGQLKKLGKYSSEVFATYNPKTSKDVFAGTQKVPNAIEVENQYDADKDSRKLWSKAQNIAKGTGYDAHNVFSNLVRQAGFTGYVQQAPVKGERWSISFDKAKATPPTLGRVMESEAVQGATKTPKNLRETLVKAVSEVQRQNRKIFEDVAKNYPEATVGHSVMSAYRGAESSSQYENSFDTFIEAPIQTLRAIASRFALEHSQESTVVQIAPSKEYPANGVNVAYDFPAGTKADDIEAAMQKAGLSDYRVISKTNSDKLSVHYFVFGDENAPATIDKFESIYNEMGLQGSIRKGSIYSEFIGKDDYEKHLTSYHGATEAGTIYRQGQQKGKLHKHAEATRKSGELPGRSRAKPLQGTGAGTEVLNFRPAPQSYAPTKTKTAYKLFRVDQNGNLKPLFIGAKETIPIGKWMLADNLPTKGYAPRPGWHAGSLPQASHLTEKGRVWAEVEIPADRDWQEMASASPTKDIRDQVPEGGYYRFPRPQHQGGEWLVAGAMKVNKVLSAEEVNTIRAMNDEVEMSYKLPQNVKEFENEVAGLAEYVGMSPSTLMRQEYEAEDFANNVEPFMPKGVGILGGDMVAMNYAQVKEFYETGKASGRDYYDISYPRYHYLVQQEPLFWASGTNLVNQINDLAKKGSRAMLIVSYPNLQGAMNTNPIYQEALRRAFYRSYGEQLVMGPMLEAAQEVIAEQTAIAQVKIEKWKSDHPGVKISQLKENNLKNNIPQSPYHAMVRVQKNFKESLVPGQKRVEMTKVAEDIADKDYYDKKKNIDYTGHVIGVAIFDKVVPPPKSGERDMRVGHDMHKDVNNYPVEIHGRSYFNLPKPVPIEDIMKLMNDAQAKNMLAKEKPLTTPLEERADWQLTQDQYFVKMGFPPSSEAGNRDRQRAMFEHHRVIQRAAHEGHHIPVEVYNSYRGYAFADKAMNLMNASQLWQNAKNMQAVMFDHLNDIGNPVIQMLIRAGHGDLSAYKDYLSAGDMKKFANEWNEKHKIPMRFKLERTASFVGEMFPEAATPVRYMELVQEARENGWLTEAEWEAANLERWLSSTPDVSVDRDQLVDYIEFRDSVYKRMEEEASGKATSPVLGQVERRMKSQGLNVKITEGKLSDENMDNFLTRIAHLFRKKLHVVNVKGDLEFEGVQWGAGDVLINANSKTPHLYVMGHELVHALRTEYPDLYNQLVERIQLDPNSLMYKLYHAKLKQNYAKTNIANNAEKMQEEIVGDLMGEFFMDKKFWVALGENNPSLLSAMYDTFVKVLNQIKKYFTGDITASAILADYDKALAQAAEVMSQYQNRIEEWTEQHNQASGISFKLSDQLHSAVHAVTHKTAPSTPRFASVNQQAQERFQKATISKVRGWEKIKNTAVKTLHEFTRHFPLLDPKKDAVITEALYQHEVAPARNRSRAIREIIGVTKGLDQNQYEIFRYGVILPDLIDYVKAHAVNFKDGLPFGYNTVGEIEQDLATVNAMIRKDAKLQGALAKRKALLDGFQKTLVQHGIVKQETLDKKGQEYFHHQVLAYMGAKNLGEDYEISTPSDVRKHKYGWQMARTGSSEDFNTNYMQAEYEVLAQGYTAVSSAQALRKIERLQNETQKQLEAQATASGKSIEEVTRQAQLNGQVSEWQPEKGNFLYNAKTISDRMLQKILDGLDENITMPAKQEDKLYDAVARKLDTAPNALVLGGRKPVWVLPANVVKTLDGMTMPTEDAMIGKASANVMKWWKQYILLNPLRAMKYMMNNLTGDLDIVLAYDPKLLKGIGQAIIDLKNFSKNQRQNPNLLKAERKGVIASGITAVEIADMDKIGTLRAMMGERQNLYSKYFEKIKAFSTFRENVLRYKAYTYFQDKILTKGERPYGASKKGAISELYDAASKLEGKEQTAALDDIAAKLARELIGDYGNVSHAGGWIRKHMIPFYSWMEVNAPRYVNLMRNLKTDEQINSTRAVAVRGGVLALKASALYAMVALWNATMFPDEDDEMKRNGRRQLHLILGRTEDGSVRSIRFQGALSDALSWFGLEQPDKTFADLVSGKKSITKQLKETALSPVNKVVMGSTPFIRTGLEAALGKSLFPDMMRPKPIRDRAEHLLRSVSLDLPYRYATGIPTKGMDTDALGVILSYSEPGEAAYYYSLQKMGEYLESVHRERPASEPTDRSNALYYYKKARKTSNNELADYWLNKYKKLGGTSKGILQSIKKSDPMAFLPVSERRRYVETLDPEDRRTLADARAWWKRVYKGSSMYANS